MPQRMPSLSDGRTRALDFRIRQVAVGVETRDRLTDRRLERFDLRLERFDLFEQVCRLLIVCH